MERLVILTSSFYPVKGGLQKYIKDLGLKLSDKYDVVIVTGSDFMGDDVPKSYEIEGLSVLRFDTLKLGGLVFLKSFISLIKIYRILKQADIIHHQDVKFIPYLPVIAKKFNSIKLYLSSHGYIYHNDRNGKIKSLYMKYFSWLSKSYDKVINVSYNDEEIANEFKLRNTATIIEGVDYSKFVNLSEIPKEGSLFYFGRVSANKGIDRLINCISIDSGLHLKVVGKPESKEYMESLNQLVKKRGLTEHVTFLGPLEDQELFEELKHVEFIVLPSLFEGFGITLIESLATGAKVITSDIKAYQDIAKELDCTAFLFDFSQPNKEQRFADKVLDLRGKPYERDQVAQKLMKFDFDNMVKQIIKIYEAD